MNSNFIMAASRGLDIGAGDCKYIESILDDAEEQKMFYDLKDELHDYWGYMHHKGGPVPRKIVIQHEKAKAGPYKDLEPIYRHPIDKCPPTYEFTPLVEDLRDRVEKALGYAPGTLNHGLIQMYESGQHHITDHTDKTLDILKNTDIINVSLGAMRKMKIKDKIKKDGVHESERIALGNGSVFVMGWQTNRLFCHGINQDNRDDKLKDEAELAFDECRISLTFRSVATYVDDAGKLHGQGASQIESDASLENQQITMLKAFSAENRNRDFDWDAQYGSGFSCINFSTLN